MDSALLSEEKMILKLRTLYRTYGYLPYKMNRFEEYDLYVKNKNFLISDNIITFTDTSGKLMALKPDVTLSIVKNSKDIKGFVQKVCYNEYVCRPSGAGKSFREIMQTGLECIGDVDAYCRAEVLLLAAESLKEIADTSLLSVAHLGIIADVLDSLAVSSDVRTSLVKCIQEKNLHDAEKICVEAGVSSQAFATL
ncbi:MAG TPA: ATP phosphoribosyltransferase regulatory subunit, partial [Methanocorpusculum sp.]|nr:ATP phosphoribosyltransferase regulatory subunit [Methanocorpusculum sp.]